MSTGQVMRPTGLRSFWGALDASQRRTLVMMIAVVGGLHVIGVVMLFALVAPSHFHLGASGTFTVGIGITAYTLGCATRSTPTTSLRSTTPPAS